MAECVSVVRRPLVHGLKPADGQAVAQHTIRCAQPPFTGRVQLSSVVRWWGGGVCGTLVRVPCVQHYEIISNYAIVQNSVY